MAGSETMEIHDYARRGDIEGVTRELSRGVPVDSTSGSDGRTPLMCSLTSPDAGAEMVRLLIQQGADVNAMVPGTIEAATGENVLGLAVRHANPEKIRLLLDAGADISYQRPFGYNVLIDAACRSYNWADTEVMPILRLLIERGAPLSGISDYSESALRITSNVGRFDAVRLLLEAGADPDQLEWTELMVAVALGSRQDVARLLAEGADLAVRDFWERTPWLLSLQTGDLDKARCLLSAGADRSDRGRCGKTPMAYAIENAHVHVLAWLIEEGFDIEATDDFGHTPLIVAAEHGVTEYVRRLLEAGASREAKDHIGQRAIEVATNLEIVSLLVEAGDDLNGINANMRALLTGVEYEGDLKVSREDYLTGKQRRLGNANPELMNIEFWRAMVRSGARAWTARHAFGDTNNFGDPVWCFHRFGKSITELPDGRIIEIGGEHEDFYDPDFCIYNDVIVHYGGSRFDILGYPRHLFPPTDFHSATLVGDQIYIIGSIGYVGERAYGETPVYRLDCNTFAIEKVETTGEKPGWISRHRACYREGSGIVLNGGKICALVSGSEEYVDNRDSYILDVPRMIWRCNAVQ
jgi:ankyrin repeat protein